MTRGTSQEGAARRRFSTLLMQLLPELKPTAVAGSPAKEDGLTIEPIPGKTIGAFVRGISLAEGNLSPEEERRIKDAFLEHGVFIFKVQHDLTLEGQCTFG